MLNVAGGRPGSWMCGGWDVGSRCDVHSGHRRWDPHTGRAGGGGVGVPWLHGGTCPRRGRSAGRHRDRGRLVEGPRSTRPPAHSGARHLSPQREDVHGGRGDDLTGRVIDPWGRPRRRSSDDDRRENSHIPDCRWRTCRGYHHPPRSATHRYERGSSRRVTKSTPLETSMAEI